jgi:lysophospholipase L1-like esterase
MKKMRPTVLAAGVFALAVAPVSAQFSKYVALGDSLTAGVEGNCLVERNQLSSFPAVLAHQLNISDFQQPLVQELAPTNPLVGNPCLGAVQAPPSFSVGVISQQGAPLNAQLARPYDNLGIPGAKTADLVDLTEGDLNGNTAQRFAVLVLRNVPGSPFNGLNAVTEANALGPDLITLWIGSNDVLGAALSGVAIPGVTITPQSTFDEKYAEVLDAITGPNRTLLVGNVPDVTSIPFTTTIPARLTIPGGTTPVLGPGNATYPCTPVAPDLGCPVPDGTLVTLPASALLAQGVGVPKALGGTGLPLPDGSFTPPATLIPGVLLYPDEVATIQQYVEGYNASISSQVAAAGGLVVDINALLEDIKAHGYHIGGLTLSSAFLSGGLFSADGFHPSSIGYMVIADAFIRKLNELVFVPQPDFSQVLFTPNVPQTGGAGVRGGGDWSYNLAMWRDLLERTGIAGKFRLQMPDAFTGPVRGGGPRKISRD